MSALRPGYCRLCYNWRNLHLSHVVPRLIFNKICDHEGRYTFVPSDEKEPMVRRQAKPRENLFCTECEALFQAWENKVARWLFKHGRPRATCIGSDPVRIKNSEYFHVKLFLMSLLYRSTVTDGGMFSRIDIVSFQELLRDMLLNSIPGEAWQFGCIAHVLKTKGEWMGLGISEPTIKYTEHGILVSWIVLGCLLTFYLGAKELPGVAWSLYPGEELKLRQAELNNPSSIFGAWQKQRDLGLAMGYQV